jgi:adenosine kinase
MVEHARDLAAQGIPFVFDPGQGLPMFSGADLMAMMKGAGRCRERLRGEHRRREDGAEGRESRARGAVIVTRGGEGSTIHADGRELAIRAVKPDALVDPTGCGDCLPRGAAVRNGATMELEKCGRLAA